MTENNSNSKRARTAKGSPWVIIAKHYFCVHTLDLVLVTWGP